MIGKTYVLIAALVAAGALGCLLYWRWHRPRAAARLAPPRAPVRDQTPAEPPGTAADAATPVVDAPASTGLNASEQGGGSVPEQKGETRRGITPESERADTPAGVRPPKPVEEREQSATKTAAETSSQEVAGESADSACPGTSGSRPAERAALADSFGPVGDVPAQSYFSPALPADPPDADTRGREEVTPVTGSGAAKCRDNSEAAGDTRATEAVRPAGAARAPSEGVQDSRSPEVVVAGAGSSRQPVADQPNDTLSQELPPGSTATESQSPRQAQPAPRKYEGLARRPRRPSSQDRQEPRVPAGGPAAKAVTLPIEIRLRFDRSGFCAVSLIAGRSSDLPEDLAVESAAGPLDLHAMQDEWYQDVVPDEIGNVLASGLIWNCDELAGTLRWSLSGRELYVLAERAGISGWISQPCLKLERKHIVLCTERFRPIVEDALVAAGVHAPEVLEGSFGVPAGWVCFRDVVPLQSVRPTSEADILNALRPLPQVEIELEGGIRLEHATWLEGYAPAIHVYGDPAHASEVQINGSTAHRSQDGTYQVAGWDAVGQHAVWCAGSSKSYRIVPFSASWEPWNAYSFPIAVGSDRRFSICGPIVRAGSAGRPTETSTIRLPGTNSVVIGATPGDYALATRASNVHGAAYLAAPEFRLVWALPRDPLHCDKETSRIMLVGDQLAPAVQAGSRSQEVGAWCRLILDASRKGLVTEPNTAAVRELWQLYKRAARRILRSRR